MKRYISIFIILILGGVGCAPSSQGTSTGNPLVAVRFQSFTAFGSSKLTAMSVSSLKMCFKRLRFKYLDGAVGQNVDISLDELTVLSSGTLITSLYVPAATYSRVEFDLDNHCASGKSIQVTNSNGSFSTNQTTTIRFDGTLVLTGSQNLDLNLQAIVTALNSVASDSDIRTQAESVGGGF